MKIPIPKNPFRIIRMYKEVPKYAPILNVSPYGMILKRIFRMIEFINTMNNTINIFPMNPLINKTVATSPPILFRNSPVPSIITFVNSFGSDFTIEKSMLENSSGNSSYVYSSSYPL